MVQLQITCALLNDVWPLFLSFKVCEITVQQQVAFSVIRECAEVIWPLYAFRNIGIVIHFSLATARIRTLTRYAELKRVLLSMSKRMKEICSSSNLKSSPICPFVGQALEYISLVPDEPTRKTGKGARCNKVLLCTLFSNPWGAKLDSVKTSV